jgi:hypothetical protein
MSNFTFELDDFAEAKFCNIIDYYKQLDRSLSADFIHEFDQSVQRIKSFRKRVLHIFTEQDGSYSNVSRMQLSTKFIKTKLL